MSEKIHPILFIDNHYHINYNLTHLSIDRDDKVFPVSSNLFKLLRISGQP